MNESGCIVTVEMKFRFQTDFLDRVFISQGIIQEGETRMDALLRVNAELEETAARLRKEAGAITQYSSGGLQPLGEIQVGRTDEDRRVAALIADIYSCQDVKVLESYKMLVKNKPDFQAAYDQQLKKLTHD